MSAMRVASQMMRKRRRKVGGEEEREGERWRQLRRRGGRWSTKVRKGMASRRRRTQMEVRTAKCLSLEVKMVGW